MNLGEFYNEAVKIAEEQGYKKPYITSFSGIINGEINHQVSLWDWDKKKYIFSGQYSNKYSALEAFKNKLIEFSKKQNNEPQMY